MKKIKIHDPYVDDKEKNGIINVFDSHIWALSRGSPRISKFENLFKKYIGCSECVAVSSGTSALDLAISLFNIKNKQVIIPSFSHISVANCIKKNQGIPKFVDIDEKTLCINSQKIEEVISDKTGLIIPVHFAGYPCNLDPIQKICKKYNVSLMEDAALATGSKYNGKKIGSHSEAVCFSFNPVKNLASSKGGLIALNGKNSKQNKKKIIALRHNGIEYVNSKMVVNKLGGNYYMDEFAGIIALTQLKKLNKIIVKRKNLARKYFNEIETVNKMPYLEDSSFNFYWILVQNRNQFIQKMSEKNIEVGKYYTPIHNLKLYQTKDKLSNTQKADKHLALLPCHPNITEKQINKIIKYTNRFT